MKSARATLNRVGATRALALVMAAGAALLLWQTRGQTMLFDEWSFFAQYRGHSPSVLLSPFAGNLELLPVLLYKAVFATAGADHYIVFRLLSVILNLLCAGLFFSLARRRVSEWAALGTATLLIFLGAAWDIVMAPLGITPLMTIALGLGMLLALEREDRFGDVLAAGLLFAALASNSLGLPFAAAAAVEVVVVSGRPRTARLWIFVPTLLLYGAWRIWASHQHELDVLRLHATRITLDNIGNLPTSIADSLASALATITGLFRAPGSVGPSFTPLLGRPLALLFGVLVFLRLRRGPAPARRVWIFVALALADWALIALAGSDRVPEVSRYQYPGALFLLLAICELASGIRVNARQAIALGAVLAMALLANLVNLHYGALFLRVNAADDRAELTAIELARGHVNPALLIEPLPGLPETEIDAVIPAGQYLSAARDLGSPAYSLTELRAAPDYAREAADRELVRALGLAPEPARRLPYSGSCLRATAPGAPTELDQALSAGGFSLKTGAAPVELALRRFGERYVVELPAVPARTLIAVAIPPDAAAQPWHARVRSAAGVRMCPIAR